MNIPDLEKIIGSLSQSGVRELRLRKPGFSLEVRRGSDQAGRSPEPLSVLTHDRAGSGRSKGDFVQSPHAGIFYGQHPAFREVNVERSSVRASDIVGFVANGVVLLPVSSPRDGVIGEQIWPDGSLVGYGTDVYELQGEGA
ncbi:biotin carboxyl carrier protein [Paraburkholderia sp. BL18I3N2]|uniref:hypothetical protein n=1 Tax=Paraburkholderia sp. BL18I3N2 TaxID=1938799 RepID=UPI000D051DB3|nr:hypothetical protein [Paraburkholderia sp. BL18I3N2]PRX21652.1 biotin carboxyl carrier protein [Paraburkholderia sp. BL18I3N2]